MEKYLSDGLPVVSDLGRKYSVWCEYKKFNTNCFVQFVRDLSTSTNRTILFLPCSAFRQLQYLN